MISQTGSKLKIIEQWSKMCKIPFSAQYQKRWSKVKIKVTKAVGQGQGKKMQHFIFQPTIQCQVGKGQCQRSQESKSKVIGQDHRFEVEVVVGVF